MPSPSTGPPSPSQLSSDCQADGPRRPHNPRGGTWTIGTTALFRPRKGLEALLEALASLRERSFDVRLRAVGPFETKIYEKEMKRRAAKLELDAAIDWVGFVRDVQSQLSKMDVFVLPSLFGEGLPMVVLEAGGVRRVARYEGDEKEWAVPPRDLRRR